MPTNLKKTIRNNGKPKTLPNDHYCYRVIWSDDDQEHVGLCAEFPSLSWLAGSPEAALQGIRNVVADAVIDMQKMHEPIPEPLACHEFSGKFMVRTLPETHRNLAIKAAEAGVSLNRFVTSKLTS